MTTKECQKQCEYKWKSLDIKDIIGTLEFESSEKAKAINQIIEKENITDLDKNTFYTDYEMILYSA